MIRSLLFLMIFWSFSVTAQKPGKNRILLIPLDDRPPCLQFTQRMGQIAGAEVVAPPLAMLGQFTTPGQSEALGSGFFPRIFRPLMRPLFAWIC
nr:DUF4127 family protein [Siphonobacter sp. SORGH_AS_0500]